MITIPDSNKLLQFLCAVDHDFPIAVSSKTDLKELAEKYCKYADLCCEYSNEEIIAVVAGYTENTPSNIAYISLVAVKKEARGKGLASKLILQFLEFASSKGLKGVHVYTHSQNSNAIKMYEKLGFVPYHPENESRPNDVHFVIWF